MEIIEWAVMELDGKNHGNTSPKNRRQVGDVTIVESREAAEKIVEIRRACRRPAAVAVSRVVTIGPWEEAT